MRNRFAHQLEAAFDDQLSNDLANAFSQHQRKMAGTHPRTIPKPRDVFATAIRVIFVEASFAVERLRDQKLYAEVLHEMVLDRTKNFRNGKSWDVYHQRHQREVEQRLANKKAAVSKVLE